jgi:hypothetical protein
MQAMKELKRGGSNGSSGSVTGEETAGEGDDMGVPHVRETKEGNNGSGGRLQMGWTGWAGLGRSVRFSFLFFLFWFIFQFSVFLFSLYLLHTLFKPGQTNF